MPRARKSGSSKSKKGQNGKFFRTYNRLLDQKKEVDRKLLRMDKQLVRMVIKQQQQQQGGARKVYVKRMMNKNTLVSAIRECMVPNKEMTMKDVLAALAATRAYRTNSGYLYTMVNNKLNRDPLVLKPKDENGHVRRGVFVFIPEDQGSKKGQSKRKTSSQPRITSTKVRSKKAQSVAAA